MFQLDTVHKLPTKLLSKSRTKSDVSFYSRPVHYHLEPGKWPLWHVGVIIQEAMLCMSFVY
jgi:hypothetical protein